MTDIDLERVCTQCGKTFHPEDAMAASPSRWGKRKFCSPECFHASRVKDYTGQTHNRLTFIRREGSMGTEATWLLDCTCGNQTVQLPRAVVSGKIKSCGCHRLESLNDFNRTHGLSDHYLYSTWVSMKERCFNPRNKAYKNYGGRGITVCDGWKHDFPAFLAHMGDRPSPTYSIDRIDNDGNYEPGNVRWATPSEQANNKRNSRRKVA